MTDGAFVTSLTVSQFRSYERARLTLPDNRSFVVLTGENGAGKTNLLEAVSLLAPGRGMRRAALGEIRRQGSAEPWAVAAKVTVGGQAMTIGTGEDPNHSGRRSVRLDGAPAKSGDVLGQYFTVLWLTPQMDRLFIEAPSGRRRFLDRLVLSLYPGHGSAVSAYERAMRERNKLIAQSHFDAGWCSALEKQMAGHGAAIAHARAEYAGQLLAQLEDMDDAVFPALDVALAGIGEAWALAGLSPVDIEDRLRETWASERRRDQNIGRTGSGPHKSDLVVRHRAKDMAAEQCSTGEQKAILVSLVLANAVLTRRKTGRGPIMLMDEVAAHLDKDRRAALFKRLEDIGGQVWLTGTDAGMFESIADHACHMAVTPGDIREAA